MLTVTTPATGTPAGTEYDLITVATARAALGIVDQADDATLQGFVSRASGVIASYCNRVFAVETVTETFRLDRLQEDLLLSRYPVIAVTSIVENGNALTVNTDYEVDAAKGIITRLYNDRAAWWPMCKVTIVYSAGYETKPGNLQQACVELVKSYYLSADRDPMVRSEATEAIGSTSYYSETLPPNVLGLLGQFRNIRMR
ncbi:MAG: phage head-tail connector protein [Hyphomicrobiaceae bacterium]